MYWCFSFCCKATKKRKSIWIKHTANEIHLLYLLDGMMGWKRFRDLLFCTGYQQCIASICPLLVILTSQSLVPTRVILMSFFLPVILHIYVFVCVVWQFVACFSFVGAIFPMERFEVIYPLLTNKWILGSIYPLLTNKRKPVIVWRKWCNLVNFVLLLTFFFVVVLDRLTIDAEASILFWE